MFLFEDQQRLHRMTQQTTQTMHRYELLCRSHWIQKQGEHNDEKCPGRGRVRKQLSVTTTQRVPSEWLLTGSKTRIIYRQRGGENDLHSCQAQHVRRLGCCSLGGLSFLFSFLFSFSSNLSHFDLITTLIQVAITAPPCWKSSSCRNSVWNEHNLIHYIESLG